MFDAHIHLAQYPEADLPRQIDEWRAAGIRGVLAVSNDLPTSLRTLELQRRWPDFVHAALGWHPEQPLPSARILDELFTLIQKEAPSLAAIGEVGLPHYALPELGEAAADAYRELLDRFAALAAELRLPLVLHAVHDKARPALETVRRHGVTAHFHWLKAPPDVVAEVVADGHYISVTPEVCWRERDQELAKRVPLPQLLLETDGPWPYGERFAGRSTSPLFLRESAEVVARLKGVTMQELTEREIGLLRKSD